MADMVTHLASGLLPAALIAPRYMGPLAIGTVLPDATGRVPQMAFVMFDVPLPDVVLWAFDVLHQPLPQILCASLVALVFARSDRFAAWLGLLAGVALHFGLDVLQDHHGQGYFLLFPVSAERFELGWIGSEATVHLAPWAGAATLAAVAWRLWKRRKG
ncbi:MAG: hypothetical protein H6737_09680 [Alphaproteobacteria bacterium]|nr:hypothetical protein [Alphaproteobacteria bacterium]